MKLLSPIISIILILIIIASPVQAQDSTGYGPDHYEVNRDLKEELNLVYIGASWCLPCREDSLKQDLEKLKLLLYEEAKNNEMNYSVIGIANDQSIEKGLGLLNSTGYFDEVIIGKKWTNTGSINFIWNQEVVRPAVPQIIVFRRSMEFKEGIEIGKKEVLIRKVGVNSIHQWLEDGVILNYD